jgi:hypothetical protein
LTGPRGAEPAGALDVREWRLDGGTARAFTWNTRIMRTTDAEYTLDIIGDQNFLGEVTRRAWINGNIPLTAVDLRELARVAIALAEEFDELSDLDAKMKP